MATEVKMGLLGVLLIGRGMNGAFQDAGSVLCSDLRGDYKSIYICKN